MKENDNNSVKTMVIKYEGTFDSLNAEFIAESILNFNNLIYEINSQLNIVLGLDNDIEVKIKPFKEGSFENILEIITALSPLMNQLFDNSNLIMASDVSKALIELFKLKLHLKNDAPQQIIERNNNIEVTNNQGVVNIFPNAIFNLLKNDDINELLNNQVNELNESSEIENFMLINKSSNESLSINKDNYQYLTTNNQIDNLPDQEILLENITLNMQVGIKNRKKFSIDFYYDGKKLTNTKIVDLEFLEDIKKGKKIANGDKLIVNLLINQKYQSNIDAYIDKEYIIKNVINHIPRNNYESLELDFHNN